MAQPLTVALPPNLNIWGNCTIRVTAIDPTTGATMTGVDVSNVSLECEVVSGNPAALLVGPFMFVAGPGA